jgi:putative SOS response-associated peptidase YedK
MKSLHDRMPIILNSSADALWLDPHASSNALHSLLTQYPSERMEAFPVSPWVSNARNQGPRCLEPLNVS